MPRCIERIPEERFRSQDALRNPARRAGAPGSRRLSVGRPRRLWHLLVSVVRPPTRRAARESLVYGAKSVCFLNWSEVRGANSSSDARFHGRSNAVGRGETRARVETTLQRQGSDRLEARWPRRDDSNRRHDRNPRWNGTPVLDGWENRALQIARGFQDGTFQ